MRRYRLYVRRMTEEYLDVVVKADSLHEAHSILDAKRVRGKRRIVSRRIHLSVMTCHAVGS